MSKFFARLIWQLIEKARLAHFEEVTAGKMIAVPIIITRDGSVIDGHHRIAIARRLNQDTIPAVRLDVTVEQVDPNEVKMAYLEEFV